MTINNSDIAIIGLSGRFPGADNIDAFWQNLLQGIESISFFSDEELELVERSVLSHPNYVKAGAVLPNIDKFDASFFGYSSKEAELIDPQQRIFLECAWEALESAGYDPGIYKGLVGVYAGSGTNSYLINNIYTNQRFAPSSIFKEPALALGLSLENERDYLPTRISYKLNLTGPSINIQTACSTSLVAVHMACQSLFNGECDIALAGGVSISVPQKTGYFYQEDMMLSPDGHCRAFDAQAKGTLFGSGVGIVVLKLLREAITDGDNIYAVIKGSAINNDGALKLGFTAPSIEGQAAVISDALAITEIDASTVTYVETHGTGTALGDPIEITALTQAFRRNTDEKGFCAIGSVKTNLGHLDAAAGIAGLIKTVLALKHKCIPPSLHFKQPNPKIDFANSPFYVNTALSEWKTNGTPRRAGVSSFGMGGTNCHVVLEEAPSLEPATNTLEQDWHILCLSAKTEKALQEQQERYVAYLKSHLDAKLADICFTANTGRKHFNHRSSFVAQSVKQLLEQLETGATASREITPSPEAIAFLFTGQGSQYVNMGRQLYEQAPTFRETLNRCDEILRPYLEKPLLSVLYPDLNAVGENYQSKINETAYTQPALFALEYALFELWKSWGIEPDVVMGHSIGEYVAACVAGVFSLEDGLKLIASRGKLMQALPQDGEMVALLASESQALVAIAPYSTYVSIAAINAPNSVVISGQRKAINAICATLEASGIKTKKLNVSHAFHSPLMEPMLGEFERVARQVNFSSPKIKLISNVTGTLATLEITTPEYWCRHIRQPVRFARCIESLEEQEINVFVEMGAKPILLGMARQCLPEHLGLWLPSLHPDQEDWQELLSSLAQLYVHGVPIDWVGFNLDYTRRRVPLPTYPFQRQRYWVEAPNDKETQALALTNNLTSSRQHPLLGQKLCLLGTKQIRFQSQISKNFPNWLQDHRVFETTIVPGTAYIEMALAAGVAVGKTENITVENVIIQKALILPDDGSDKIIQLVLTPQLNLSYTFEIFSLETTPNEDNEEPQGILHASGNLLVKDNQYQVETIDLATLKSQCKEEVSTEALYQRHREQNINYGESFRALAQVWRQGTVALGKICLAEKLRAEVEDYQLHPVLLDASLQVLDATFLEDNYQNTYVPIGVERLLFYSRPSADIWCCAQLRQGKDRSQKTISADFRLFADDGELIALVEGFQLKHAPRDAMLGTKEKSWQDWLYEVEWRPQARYGLFPNYLPNSAEVGLRLQFRLTQLRAHPSLTAYGQAYAHLEAFCVTYIVATLQEMGWEFQQGATFSTEQIVESLGIVTQHKRLLNRLLEILVEVGILQRFEEGWEVVSSPEIHDSIAKIDSLSYPEAEAEITLLDRCVSNLAQVLTGKCDPLQLLFPNGDTTALIKLYQDSPIMQVTNTLVKEAVLSALERLPQGRGLRILEIGAGTGSTTNYLLPHLFTYQTEYLFTDIGAFFIAKAQERFKDYPFVSYQVLDIEKDPQSQGFEPSHFDLIVAVNVLHATSNLRSSLRHVKQLLAPGGMLVLMEDTAPQRWMDLTFGLTEGWWKFSDRDLRPNYLLLPPQKWRELLRETGFSQVETISTNQEASEPAILLPQETVIVARAEAESQISTPRNWLILADTQGTGQQLGEIMRSWGEVCTLVFQSEEYEQIASGEFRINPANPSHFQQLLQAIPTVAGVVHLWSLDAPEILSVTDLEETSKTCCGSTLHLVQALVNNYTKTPRLWLVTRGAQAVNGHHVEQVAQSPLWGMGKVIAVEHPELKCVRVDLDPIATGNDAQILFEEIISSLSAEGTEDQIAFRGRDRYVPRLVNHRQSQKTLGQMSLHSDGTYLITGGLGGLGLLVAQWLVERGAKHLVLLSRSGFNPSASERLEKLEQAGACVKIVQADVSDNKQLDRVWSEIELFSPPLRGIIHAAGVLDDGVLLQQNWQRFDRVLAPKVQGAWNLHTLTQNRPLDFFVLFSSATSLLGNAGQANHAAANAFLDALASYRRMLGLPGLSINWGTWAEVGAAARMGLVEQLSLKGEESIAPQQGLQVLEQLLLNPPVQVGVMPINWSRFLQQRKSLSPFFTDLAAEIQQLGFRSTSVTPQEGDSLKKAIWSGIPAERQQLLESGITEQVARVLGFSTTKFDRQESLINLGLDSLMAIELRNRLNNEMGVNLSVMKIMEGVSISSLAEVMLEQWALTQIQSASPSTELDDTMEEIAL
ncbi:type I polyketide synthase [Microcoleus sp. B9-D4]|uniref:type I polyketide synthase n=1 Tax=Microcoleus sp. B9-D4 TaxID=2818711 RepID=UPI002FD09F87